RAGSMPRQCSGSILSACPGGDAAAFFRHGCRLESRARACLSDPGSGCGSRILVEHGVSRRRSFMSRPSIACGSARLAAIPPVRARAAITVAVLCAALSGGFALDVRADRNAIYQPATSRFSQNVSLRAPVATRHGAPTHLLHL